MTDRANTKQRIVYLLTHSEELAALRVAEEGDVTRLVEIFLRDGSLKTTEAQQFVAARLRGDKRKRGNKRTSAQLKADFDLFMHLQTIMQENSCTEYHARKILLEQNPKLNEETLKTRIRRLKREMLREAQIGKDRVQKPRFLEPE